MKYYVQHSFFYQRPMVRTTGMKSKIMTEAHNMPLSLDSRVRH